jgi:hypothetical protein
MRDTFLATTNMGQIIRRFRTFPGLLILALTLALTTSGCAGYDVTLKNRTMYTNVRKPKYDKKTGFYKITTVSGRSFEVKRSQIDVIEPHMSEKERRKSAQFSD